MARPCGTFWREMIRLTVFFGDAESADHDLRGNRMLNCFCGHWQQIRGTYVYFSDSSVKRMAEQNPALYDEFEAEEEPEGELPRDDTEYVYCKVPFGMENVVKRGKVASVTRCTRRTAPWPPEETKTVLCMTEQPTEFEMQ